MVDSIRKKHNNLCVWDYEKIDNGTVIFVDGERLKNLVRYVMKMTGESERGMNECVP